MSNIPQLEIDREAFAIVAVVADYHDVAPRLLLCKSHARRLVDLRKQACYLMRQILDLSFSDIGRAMGGLDHSSASYAISQAEVRYASDPCWANQIDELRTVAEKTISDFRRHPLPEEGGKSRHSEPLEVAKRVMRSPRGEIRLSGADMRVLAEAYVDVILRHAGGAS